MSTNPIDANKHITDDNSFFEEDSAHVHCACHTVQLSEKMWCSCFPVLPGSTKTQVIWGGIVKQLLIVYFIRDIFAIKYQNPFMCVKVIARQRWDVFETRCITVDVIYTKYGIAVAIIYSIAIKRNFRLEHHRLVLQHAASPFHPPYTSPFHPLFTHRLSSTHPYPGLGQYNQTCWSSAKGDPYTCQVKMSFTL